MVDRVLEFLRATGVEKPGSGLGYGFESLAMEVFSYQYGNNPGYRRWCESVGRTPGSIKGLDDIPAVPTSAFKEMEFVCGSPAHEFRTSGTSGAGQGRHLLPSLEPYRVGALSHFVSCVMPERWKMRTLMLAPSPEIKPHSSLSRMLAWILSEWGEKGSGWYVSGKGLERERLAEMLLDSARGGVPVLLAGTTAAFLDLFDFCSKEKLKVVLPGGSRIMDTGGRKGTGAREYMPLGKFQELFREKAGDLLGVAAERCVNEYGMTELCSQFYDSSLVDAAEKRERRRVLLGPPWVLTTVLNPVTLEKLPEGRSGILKHLDLANVGSVMSVLTEDMGHLAEGGFVLEGRPADAEDRGCGLTFEELSGGGGA